MRQHLHNYLFFFPLIALCACRENKPKADTAAKIEALKMQIAASNRLLDERGEAISILNSLSDSLKHVNKYDSLVKAQETQSAETMLLEDTLKALESAAQSEQ